MEQNLEDSVSQCWPHNKQARKTMSSDFLHLPLQFAARALLQTLAQVQVCSTYLLVGPSVPSQRVAAPENVFTGEVRSSQRSR